MPRSPVAYTWTELPDPVLARGRIPDLADIVYRRSATASLRQHDLLRPAPAELGEAWP